jgi:RHS repeat-associated protein
LQNDATARDNKYQYNGKELNDDFGLNWNDYGARWYDASVGRFTSVDRFAVKYNSHQPYHYGLNNPVVFIDINGDSIKYANTAIEEYVNKYTSATVTDKKGRVKENKNYNAGFAALVNRLKDSKDMFVFTDDASKMKGNNSGQLGEFNSSDDGNSFNIVVPDFSSGEKAKLTDIFGGRGAVLAEEVFHATQYLGGELGKVKGENGKFGLKVNSNTTMILVEADAKIYASGSGMGYSSTTSYVEDYNVPTMTGLIYGMNGDRQAVGRLLIHGTMRNIDPVFGSGGSRTVKYPASYSIY